MSEHEAQRVLRTTPVGPAVARDARFRRWFEAYLVLQRVPVPLIRRALEVTSAPPAPVVRTHRQAVRSFRMARPHAGVTFLEALALMCREPSPSGHAARVRGDGQPRHRGVIDDRCHRAGPDAGDARPPHH